MDNRRGKKRCQWRQEDMTRALQACRNGMTPSNASREFNIPRKTLDDRLKNRVPETARGSGGVTYLTAEQEQSLCGYIRYMAERAFPQTINQIKHSAWLIDKESGRNKFGPEGPSNTWWAGFKSRHPDAVKLRRPDLLDRGRAIYSTANQLRHYFQLLKTVLESGNFAEHPENIYNCDETIVDLNKSTQKVVVPKRMRTAHSRQVAPTDHISILCCVSAAGRAMPPFIIFKGSFPGGHYTTGGPPDALYGKQDSGFMDSELFLKWFNQLFMKHADPQPEKPVLLLVDGHSSHCSMEIIEAAKEKNVTLLALAPHTTHLTQVLDVSVYKPFKNAIARQMKAGQSLRGDLWVPKTRVPSMLKIPLEEALTEDNIKNGFRKCGIHPFNPNAIDVSQLFRNQLLPDENIDLSIHPLEEPPAPLEEPIAPVEELPTPLEESLTPLEEPPAHLEEPLAPFEEPPAPLKELSAPLEEPPAPLEEHPAPLEEPLSHLEEPLTPLEEPLTPLDEPLSPLEEPLTPLEEPLTTLDEPLAPLEEPPAPLEETLAPLEEPLTPLDEPLAPLGEPPSPLEEPPAPLEGTHAPLEETPAPLEEPCAPDFLKYASIELPDVVEPVHFPAVVLAQEQRAVTAFKTFDNRGHDLMDCELVSDVTNEAPRSPIVIELIDEAAVEVIPLDNNPISIKITTGITNAPPAYDFPLSESILITDRNVYCTCEATENPLVTAGIISPELRNVFRPPPEIIPKGRKRPLRVQSKARVMTDDAVLLELRQQKISIEQKQRAQEERKAAALARRAETAVSTRRGAASTRRGAVSPRRGAASTRRGAASTRRGAASTRRGAASTRRGSGSTGRGAVSPRRGAASTRRGAASTRREAAFTRRGAASTRRGSGSTGRGALSNRRGASTTRRGGASPGRGAASNSRETSTASTIIVTTSTNSMATLPNLADSIGSAASTSTAASANSVASTSKGGRQQTGGRAITHQQLVLSNSDSSIELEKLCTFCGTNYYSENEKQQRTWAKCDNTNCDKWMCGDCLPADFNYNAIFICDYCDIELMEN